MWEQWRLTYLGGPRFLKRYLRKFGRREDDQTFRDRAGVSYVPAFAKSAINEIRNSIFKNMIDVVRMGGSSSYRDAMKSVEGHGIDLYGSSLDTFIGKDILPELLTMARVGVFVDMPRLIGPTIAEKGKSRPYCYYYKAEDIRSWTQNTGGEGNPTDFKALLLRDSSFDVDEHWILPYETTTRYRYLWIGEDGYVHCQFYSQDGDELWPAGYENGQEIILPIRRIPFVLFELSDSLLADVSMYQIAHLNLASSDVAYALASSYAMYTEQYDPRSEGAYIKQPNQTGTTQTSIDPTTATVYVTQEKNVEVRLGASQGRRYPLGTDRPGFISPSPDPLTSSMAKQEQMKAEIKQLVSLAVSSLQGRDNKNLDVDVGNDTFTAGLAIIGKELEHGERKIAAFWELYEGGTPATIYYPTSYNILSEEDRKVQIDALTKLLPLITSITARREISKRIARLVLGNRIEEEKLTQIEIEIDADPVVIGDPAVIESDVQNGLVDLNTASLARGYPPGCVDLAKVDHAERLARIAEHQSKPNLMPSDPGARGVADQSGNPKAPVEEKTNSQQDQTTRIEVKDRTRGEAK